MGAALIMAALAVLARAKPGPGLMLLSAALAALAAMVTIKVGLYAPAFAGVAAWRLCSAGNRRSMLSWLAGAAFATAIAFALLYILQLSLVAKASNAGSQAMLGNAAKVQFLEYGFLPRDTEIWRAVLISPVQTIFILVGMIGVLAAFVRSTFPDRCRLAAIGGCGATLLCLLFYRNAFPYFFAFITPPAMLLVAWVVEQSSLLKRKVGLAVVCVAMVADAAVVSFAWIGRDRPPQREVVAAVHDIFPQPIPMIDHCHMIGSFPKRGFFMSTWGMASYRGGPPRFAAILQNDTVPLLLLDSPRLAEAVGASPEMKPAYRLHDEDRAILRENYVRHWGPIWVAGKRLHPGSPTGKFEILIPGTYTLEGEALTIDSKPVSGGSTVRLARGQHHFTARTPSTRLLRWGNKLPKPDGQGPSGPLFVGF